MSASADAATSTHGAAPATRLIIAASVGNALATALLSLAALIALRRRFRV